MDRRRMRNGKFNTTQYNLIQYELCGSTAAGPAMSIRLKTLPVDEQPSRFARRPDTAAYRRSGQLLNSRREEYE